MSAGHLRSAVASVLPRTADNRFDWATADVLLAGRVPHLCPDCKGSGVQAGDIGCSHGRALTVGRLLAIGQACWTWDEDDLDVTVAEQRCVAALRAVEQ